MRLTKRCCLPRAGPHATLRYHNACRHKPWPSMAQVERNLAAFGAVPTGQAAAAASTADAKAGGAGSALQAAAASAAAVEGGGGGEDSSSLQAGEGQEPDDPSLPPKPALPDGSRWRCVRKEEQTLSLLLQVCVFLHLPGQSISLLMFVPSLSWQLILVHTWRLTRVSVCSPACSAERSGTPTSRTGTSGTTTPSRPGALPPLLFDRTFNKTGSGRAQKMN
jgi:nucleoid-associated protein YgaU